jgi:ectoine hydroxylase-related dioxygenase (phytanoyl-CoA dioxygenase family)
MSYQENGYIFLRNFFENSELEEIHPVVLKFHEAWKNENLDFYSTRAVNSAYLTGIKYLNVNERLKLFNFISSSKILNILLPLLDEAMFMNTQLFFNPSNKEQKNYWHRDPQYHLSEEQQKEALKTTPVLHFRVPFLDEPGIELIPGSHAAWDTDEELEIRLEKNGHKNFENLSTGKTIKLNAGDLFVFSANMIHRGLYGMDRLALDILFCKSDPELAKFIDKDCLPSQLELQKIKNPEIFLNSLESTSRIR